MKIVTIFLIQIILYSFFGTLYAQDGNSSDRLSQVRTLAQNNELIMIWSQGENQNEHYSKQRIYNLDLTDNDVNERLIPGTIHTDSIVTGNRQMAVASGNFYGGHTSQLVAAWPGPDQSVTLMIPDIDSETLSWTDAFRLSLPGPLYPVGPGSNDIHLATGDFMGNNRSDEFVVAYHGADNRVHLKLFAFDAGNFTPQERGSVNDAELFVHDNQIYDEFDIIAGDFNNNGNAELALIYVKPLGGLDWAVTIAIYSVNHDGDFVHEISKELFYKPDNHQGKVRVSAESSNFNFEPSDELAVSFTADTDQFGGDDTYLFILDIVDDLAAINSSPPSRFAGDFQTENFIAPLNIASGDLNGNFKNEIVLASGGSARIFTVSNELIPELRLTRSTASVTSDNSHGNENYFLAIGDMQGTGNEYIVTAVNDRHTFVNGTQYFNIQVMSIDSTFSSSEIIARREFEEEISSDTGYRNFAIAMGDFLGNRTWLGDPVHYRRNAILQPSVVLNAPPVHYDILNSTVYDVNDCFPNQGCGFQSAYTQTSINEETVSIEIHEDWGTSAEIEASVPGLKAKVEDTYGEKFSNTAVQRETITISTGRTAAGDDWIYANLFDVDLYEYPVYDGDSPEPLGYYLVSIPSNIRPLWIEGKNDEVLGNQFRPNHEVGNILSYSSYDSEESIDIGSPIVTFPEQTVGATGSSSVSLLKSTFSDNSATESWEAGSSLEISTGLEINFYGIEAGMQVTLSGEYNTGEIVTQTVSVGESLEMKSDFGSIRTDIGVSGTYNIEPSAYWTPWGALVLDYKVDIPDGNNFWHEHYSGPDPGFSLPWRYDQQKGIPLPNNNSDYLQRTKDIILSKTDPDGGDLVTISARVRNMGLQDISEPVTVDFYFNDPSSSGVLIEQAVTDTIIAARSFRIVSIEWQIPDDADLNNSRIYAVLDAGNSISADLHTNNNTGWAPVISTGIITGNEHVISGLPVQVKLHQAYPNPFNPATTIGYELPEYSQVRLEVFNIIGQRVAILVNEAQTAGFHEVRFDASNLSSGVYLYRLTTVQSVQTNKMVLLK